MSHKLYNPKAHAPAIYMPAWLLQVSMKLLSNNAKMLYGRLAQWANERCQVFRSIPQLAEEIGCSQRNVNRYLLELKEVNLIRTFHPQAGGVNHYEFLHHPWMDEPINRHLSYPQGDAGPSIKTEVTPRQICRDPHDKFVTTPTTNLSSINNKEIKEIKCVGAKPTAHTQKSLSSKKQNPQTRTSVKDSPEIQELFLKKFKGRKVSYDEMFDSCQAHYASKRQAVTLRNWKLWVEREETHNYLKINPSLSFQESSKLKSCDEDAQAFRNIIEVVASKDTGKHLAAMLDNLRGKGHADTRGVQTKTV